MRKDKSHLQQNQEVMRKLRGIRTKRKAKDTQGEREEKESRVNIYPNQKVR
jgi:hypothetical protein